MPDSTAGKSVVWDEGRRLLGAKQATGEPVMIASRQGTVRRPLMAVKSDGRAGSMGVLWSRQRLCVQDCNGQSDSL